MTLSPATRYRVRHWCRTRFVSVALLTLLVALMGGAVAATAAGAHRTQTAPDRNERALGGGHDLLVNQQGGDPTTSQVAELPAASNVDALTFMFFGGVTEDGTQIDALPFAGTIETFDGRIVEGRQPDPGNVNEFVATPLTAEQGGIEVGDTVHFLSLSPEAGDAFGFDPNHADGPAWDATLVGIFTSASELEDDGGLIVFPPARLDGSIHVEATLIAVKLTDGATEDELRRQLDTTLPELEYTITPAATVSPEIRTAVRGQSIGLWLLAALGAIAAVAAIGHLLARSARLTEAERSSLGALGSTPKHLIGEAVARAAVVVISGSALALVAAATASDVFPFGFARRVEPSPGLRVDVVVLGASIVSFAVLLLAWVAVSAYLELRQRLVPVRPRAGLTGSIAVHTPSPTMATGLRFAFTRREGTQVPLVAAVGGTMLSAAALIGTLTFGVSLDRMTHDSARWGENFDMGLDNGAEQVAPEIMRLALDNPNVSDIELYRASLVGIDGELLPVLTSESVRGAIDPVVLAGRLPAGDDEIALGVIAARQLGVETGDSVTLTTRRASLVAEVVGTIVAPGIAGFDVLAQNSYVEGAAYDALFGAGEPETATLRFRPGTDVGAEFRNAAEALNLDPGNVGLQAPSAIFNLRRVTFVPFVLSALLLALGSVALMGTLWSQVRRREQQSAVFRALGADRHWLRRVSIWQALAFTVVPASAGAVLGLVVGRLVYRNFADDKGVVDTVTTPWLLGLGALTLLVLLATGAAVTAGRRGRLEQPAYLLRTG